MALQLLMKREMKKMLYKVYKFIFADMDKEEAWINEMAEKGFNFIDNFFMRYTFSEGTPNEYTYRIEMLEHKANHPLGHQYINFLKETGVECVTTSGRWAYFRKKTADGPFDLYSDTDARIQHYKRILSYTSVLLLLNLLILSIDLVIAILRRHPSNISVAISVSFFTAILIKTVFHYRKKIKELKEDQNIHE